VAAGTKGLHQLLPQGPLLVAPADSQIYPAWNIQTQTGRATWPGGTQWLSPPTTAFFSSHPSVFSFPKTHCFQMSIQSWSVALCRSHCQLYGTLHQASSSSSVNVLPYARLSLSFRPETRPHGGQLTCPRPHSRPESEMKVWPAISVDLPLRPPPGSPQMTQACCGVYYPVQLSLTRLCPVSPQTCQCRS
jgi:hypothetical protein